MMANSHDLGTGNGLMASAAASAPSNATVQSARSLLKRQNRESGTALGALAGGGEGLDGDLKWLLGIHHTHDDEFDLLSSSTSSSSSSLGSASSSVASLDDGSGEGANTTASRSLFFDFHRSPAIAEAQRLHAPLETLLRRIAGLLR
jgi:hypothetical protein